MRVGLSLVIVLFVFSGCFMSKTVQLAKGGELNASTVYQEFDFEYFKGMIYVPVQIEGETYNFMFDSGAFMNVISVELAAKLNLKEGTTSNVKSSSGRKQESGFVALPSIWIDGVEFIETGTIIQDLAGLNLFLGCHEIDGIIGNNLMRKANWQIDYENQKIRFTDQPEKLHFSEEAHIIPISKKKWGNKHLEILINGEEGYYTFDTGFSGYIQNDSKFLKKLEANNDLEFVTSKGLLSADLFGATYSETKYVAIESLELEGINVQDLHMKFKDDASSLLGNEFYEHFQLTMDWANQRVILDPVKQVYTDTLEVFELIIAPNYEINRLEVKGVWLEHVLENTIEIGSTIIKIQGEDVSHFSKEELCDYWNNSWEVLKKREKIAVELEHNYSTKVVMLNKEVLLPKLN